MGKQIPIYLGIEDEKNLLLYLIDRQYTLVHQIFSDNMTKVNIINSNEELIKYQNYENIFIKKNRVYCVDSNVIIIDKKECSKGEIIANFGIVEIDPLFINQEKKRVRKGRIYSTYNFAYTEEQNESIKETYIIATKWIKKNVPKRKFKTNVLSIDGNKIIENYEINSYMSDEIYDMLTNQGYISYI